MDVVLIVFGMCGLVFVAVLASPALNALRIRLMTKEQRENMHALQLADQWAYHSQLMQSSEEDDELFGADVSVDIDQIVHSEVVIQR